jgi:MoaA/NifB/PqqE/SkfB family radical SAM enzyme
MTTELFYKVVQELIDIDFDGVVQLFLLNEPTLDKTLKEKARLIRDCLPKVTIYISTNGDTFCRADDSTESSAIELTEWFDSGINVINLNTYDSGVEQHTRHRALMSYGESRGLWEETYNKYRKHSVKKRFLAHTDMRVDRPDGATAKTDMFYNRKNEERTYGVQQVHCARPHRHIVVRYDGIVPICCAIDPAPVDPNQLIVAGDLNVQTLSEVWNGDAATSPDTVTSGCTLLPYAGLVQ